MMLLLLTGCCWLDVQLIVPLYTLFFNRFRQGAGCKIMILMIIMMMMIIVVMMIIVIMILMIITIIILMITVITI